MTKIPTISTGSNWARVDLPNGNSLWFSYRTLIAFRLGSAMCVRENDWGPTTGKHLNEIDGGGRDAKARRMRGEAFEAAYQQAFGA